MFINQKYLLKYEIPNNKKQITNKFQNILPGVISKVFVVLCNFFVFLCDKLLNGYYTKVHREDTEDHKEKNCNHYALLRQPHDRTGVLVFCDFDNLFKLSDFLVGL